VRAHSYSILDVFAEKKYVGNQLAVVREAGDLSSRTMQQIASEMNFSETTFILSDHTRRGGYDVRIFTTTRELPFAGHPTIGTAFIIQKEIVKKRIPRLVLNLKYGPVGVTFDYLKGEPSVIWLSVKGPKFGRVFSHDTIARMVGVDRNEVDERYPAQMITIGFPFIAAPLKSLSALKRVNPNADEFRKAGIGEILLFSPEPRERGNDLSVRFFSESYGIVEDPATGSANCGLAAYLVKHNYFGKKRINIRVDQGHERGRPSLLHLRGEIVDGRINASVGGHVVLTGKGELV
jgi:trans-2,3-dihydro-3-hydroxyanthranilate isomerase